MLSFTTALGVCVLEWDDGGITRVHLPGSAAAARGRQTTAAPPLVREAAALITQLLAGEAADLTAVTVSHGPGVGGFAREVYAATRRVGPGQTTTYGEIARQIDPGAPPGAARAVGAALGANPTPIIVPCHRVLAADGSLHGFSAPGGIATKRRMLQIEGAPGFAQQHLFW
jgi:methylated-DNA-[protein]-cysteine S-methyltransferase